ncbi:hypothetical protein [Acidiphilium sp.]|uniref:hypothetical protein n=1 Tax=Acidiphilium sp. TaxID=527 RepID=UPI003D04E483
MSGAGWAGDDDLALRAGPAPVSPPLAVAFLILALGVAGPFVFVRDAVPSVFLTVAALLLPVAGGIAVIASVGSWRRFRADRAVRTRAIIGAEGIVLMARHGEIERYRWAEIAAARVSASVLTLHLRGEDGKHTRRAIRYQGLETPVEMLAGRIATATLQPRDSVTPARMS